MMVCCDGDSDGGNYGNGEMVAVVASGGRRKGYKQEWGKVEWLELVIIC